MLFLILQLILLPMQDPATSVPEDLGKLLAIVDQFDSHSVKDLPFVKVSERMGGTNYPTFGFLMRDDGQYFTVLRPDLTWRTFRRSPAGTPVRRRTDFKKIDFTEYVERLLRGQTAAEEDDDEGSGACFTVAPLAKIWPVTLARACLQRGLSWEAAALWKRIEDRDEVREAMGPAMAERVLRAFAEPSLGRIQLLDLHRKWIRMYDPEGRSLEMKQRTELLEKSIEEDKVRKPAPGKAATKKEESESLVQLLTDEVWQAPSGELPTSYCEGGVHADAPMPAKGSTVSERLVALGVDAAPALIAALGDERPIRFLRYDDDADFGYVLEEVGRRAERLLQQISGFDYTSYEIDESRAFWEEWRRGVTEKGEEAYLAEIVASAGDKANCAAHRLLKRFPRRYPDAIKGARKTDNGFVRSNILLWLRPIHEAEVTRYFLESLKDDDSRLIAAGGLLDRGRREGVLSVIECWKQQVRDLSQEELGKYDRENNRDRDRRVDEWSQMPLFMLSSEDVEAIRVLLDTVASQPALIRRAVFKAFFWISRDELVGRTAPDRKAELTRIVEEGLLKCLEDREPLDNGLFVRICDEAARLLARYWPDRYTFDSGLPLRAQELSLLKYRNEWRKRQGNRLLEAVPVRDFRSKDPEISKHLDQLIAAEDPTALEVEIEALRKAGLGALPWIQERVKKLWKHHDAVPDLTRLANQLADIVGETRLDTGDWKAPPHLGKLLTALEGRRLDSEGMVALALEAMKLLPEGCGTVEVHVDRLGDGKGTYVELRAKSGPRVTTLRARTWAGVRTPSRSGNDSAWEGPWSEWIGEGVAETRGFLGTAFGVPHDKAMEAVLGLQCE